LSHYTKNREKIIQRTIIYNKKRKLDKALASAVETESYDGGATVDMLQTRTKVHNRRYNKVKKEPKKVEDKKPKKSKLKDLKKELGSESKKRGRGRPRKVALLETDGKSSQAPLIETVTVKSECNETKLMNTEQDKLGFWHVNIPGVPANKIVNKKEDQLNTTNSTNPLGNEPDIKEETDNENVQENIQNLPKEISECLKSNDSSIPSNDNVDKCIIDSIILPSMSLDSKEDAPDTDITQEKDQHKEEMIERSDKEKSAVGQEGHSYKEWEDNIVQKVMLAMTKFI
jgi:hypothetical protein